MAVRLSACAAACRDLIQTRLEVQRARRLIVLADENHRRTRAEVHADFPRQAGVALDEFGLVKENRADFKGGFAGVRRGVVGANQTAWEIVKLGGEPVGKKVPALPERRDKISIGGGGVVVGLRTIIFVVEEIIFPIGAADVRPQLHDGNFLVDIN